MLIRPLACIFLIQALMTMSAYAISVIAPIGAIDIGLKPESIGFLSSTVYLNAMLVGLATQSLLTRFGPTATFQLLLVAVGLGCVGLIAANPLLAFVGAALIGMGTGPMNPTGSYVLARITTPRSQPMIFSIKQCATPTGGMLAGAVLPPVALLWGWQWALALIPLVAMLLYALAPYGGMGRRDPASASVSASSVIREIPASLKAAFSTRALCVVVLTGSLLGICQLGIAAYYVVYLWSELGMTPTEAGQVFVLFHVAGIAARIALGAIAQRIIPTRVLLPAIGALLGVSILAAAAFDAQTSATWIVVVTVLLGASGNAWVGLFYSELARLEPERTAMVAGGAQFMMFSGISVGPLLYGVVLNTGLTHAHALTTFAALAFMTLLLPLLVRSRAVP